MIPGKIYVGTTSRIAIDVQKEWWEKNYGITIAFHKPTLSADDAISDMFPKEECERDIKYGAIPIVNWVLKPFEGFRPIAKGKFDDTVKRFAHQLAEFGYPIVLIPFEQANEDRRYKEWGNYPGTEYLDGWVHIHDLCKREGANRNTIWSTKLKLAAWEDFSYPDPFQYIPPKEYVDIIGWQTCNLNVPHLRLYSQSLRTLFTCYYKQAERKYPTLPQAFWEYSSNQDRWQHKWLDDGFTEVENRFVRVKIVMLDEINWTGPFAYIANLSPKSVKAVAKHFRN
jgi:hypothetical protein